MKSFGIRAWLVFIPAVLLVVSPALAADERLPMELLKSGSVVRLAFRSVVEQPSRTTVEIYSGERQLAFGAIVDSAGYVLTKASQLDGNLECRLKDDRRFKARIVGVSQEYDLAMLKLEATDLPTVQWKKSPSAVVGQWLATPGLQNVPVAVGVVSVRLLKVPPERGVLGVETENDDEGVRVKKIFANSGAEKAGLKVGDVISRVAGTVVKSHEMLVKRLSMLLPGDGLTLSIRRGEMELSLRAILGRPFQDFFSRANFQNRMGGELSSRRAGFPAVIVHDTVLTPQQCGGPVVDLSGKTVGINIARAGRTETYALSAHQILPLLEDLKTGKLSPSAFHLPKISPKKDPSAKTSLAKDGG